MVTGILDYSAYIPKYRVKAKDVENAWGEFLATGITEKAIPCPDEDVITMATEACIGIINRGIANIEEVKAIFFATTTPHYVEKELASTLVTFLGIPKVFTANFGYSIKSGSSALIAALTYAQSVNDKGLVVAADIPWSSIFETAEHEAGGGAAAFLIDGQAKDAIVLIDGFSSECYEVLGDRFRVDGEKKPKSLEVRAYNDKTLKQLVTNCTKTLLNRLNYNIDMYEYIIAHQPNGRTPLNIASYIGASREKVTRTVISNIVGYCGCAMPLISLAYVLDNSKPNEKILLISYGYGGGCDAISLTTTEKISEVKQRKFKVKDYIDSKEYLDFKAYLKYKGLVK